MKLFNIEIDIDWLLIFIKLIFNIVFSIFKISFYMVKKIANIYNLVKHISTFLIYILVNFDNQKSEKSIKSKKFSNEDTIVLENWYIANLNHPYPTSQEKEELVNMTNLSIEQISKWLSNRRHKKKLKVLILLSKFAFNKRYIFLFKSRILHKKYKINLFLFS